MRELSTRAIAGAVFVGLILTAIQLSFASVAVLMSLFLYICCTELSELLSFSEKQKNALQVVSVISYYLLISTVFIPLGDLYYVPFALVSGSIVALVLFKEYTFVFAMIYLVIPLALLSFIGIPDYQYLDGKWTYSNQFNTDPILAIFVFMWCFDTFAFLTGKFIGKTPLAPKISPKKTWEGFWGGLLVTMSVALLVSELTGLNLGLLLPLSICVAVAGTIGDLFESFIKRKANVKDSGNLIPGHGGLLDRLDGLLIAIPVCVSYIYIYNYL